jgi:invasion protein IalB
MKFLAIVAAALVTTAAMSPAPASAAPNAPRHGAKWKTVCKVQVRHGHRNRVCRKVRAW